MTTLKNRVVVVTGATSGIGLATARLLAALEAHVVMVGRDQAALGALSTELPGSLAVHADMSQPDDVRTMIRAAHAARGRIDVLINNAAQGYEGAIAEAESEKYGYLFRLNVLGPMVAMQEVIPLMRAAGSGRIVNVCSPVAKMALPGLGLYASTKAALRTLTLTARAELASDGITVSVFYPFITSTRFGERVLRPANAEPLVLGNAMPDPDTPAFTAQKLIEAIDKHQKEISTRGSWHFLYGMARKRLQKGSTLAAV
jgi:short-subunit dehydrogenase